MIDAHPFTKRLNRFVRCWRRLVLVRGLAWSVVWAVLALLGGAVADYLARFQSGSARWALTAAVAAVCSCAIFVFVLRPLRRDWSARAAAAAIERRIPQLRNILLSAVEFAEQKSVYPGESAQLRAAATEQAIRTLESVDLDSLFDRRPVRRALTVSGVVCALAVVWSLLRPEPARAAVQRVFVPWSDCVWPQQTRLKLGPVPERIARGEAFEVRVLAAEGSRLPATIEVWFRDYDESGNTAVRREIVAASGGSAVIRRLEVQRSFSFRVEGGDDRSMPWHEVEVVTPPRIVALHVRLEPPQYSGRPPTESVAALIRALVGTGVRMTVELDRPAAQVKLVWPGTGELVASAMNGGKTHRFPAAGELLQVGESGAYWFDLVDRDGLVSSHQNRGEVVAVPDSPPRVRIESPEGDAAIAADAEVLIRLAAEDDVGLKRLGIALGREESAAPAINMEPVGGPRGNNPPIARIEDRITGDHPGEPIWIWNTAAETMATPTAEASMLSADTKPVRRRAEYRCSPARHGFAAGERCLVYAVAEDSLGQRVFSGPVRVALLSPEQFAERAAMKWASIAGEIRRAVRIQEECLQQSVATREALAAQSWVPSVARERIMSVEARQRQVHRIVCDPREGAAALIRALSAEAWGMVAGGETVRQRLSRAETTVALVEELIVRRIFPALNAAEKALESAENRPADRAAAAESLARAISAQREVVAALLEWLDRAARDEEIRQVETTLHELAADQQALLGQTQILSPETLGRAPADLPPPQRRALADLENRQRELANRLERTLDVLTRRAEEQVDPSAQAVVAEMRRRATADLMRQAAQAVGENRLGLAMERQQSAAADLQHLVRLAREPRGGEQPHSSSDTQPRLVRFHQLLAELIESQRRCLQQTENAFADGNQPSVEERAGLAAVQRTAAERLRHETADERSIAVTETARLVAARMDQIVAALLGGDPGGPIIAQQQAVLAMLRRLAAVAEAASASASVGVDLPPGEHPPRPEHNARAQVNAIELQLLVEWQRDLSNRTLDLRRRWANGAESEELKSQLESLRAEQESITRAAIELIERGTVQGAEGQ